VLCLCLLYLLNIESIISNVRLMFPKSYCFCQGYGSCTTECVSGDWFDEVKEEDLADLKQESDVCCVLIQNSVYYKRKFSLDPWSRVNVFQTVTIMFFLGQVYRCCRGE